jgi:hypothetical protein
MPSAELLAAAAKLTEAQAELRYFFQIWFGFILGYNLGFCGDA